MWRTFTFPVLRSLCPVSAAIVSHLFPPGDCLLNLWPPAFCFNAGNRRQSFGDEFLLYNDNQFKLFIYEITLRMNFSLTGLPTCTYRFNTCYSRNTEACLISLHSPVDKGENTEVMLYQSTRGHLLTRWGIIRFWRTLFHWQRETVVTFYIRVRRIGVHPNVSQVNSQISESLSSAT
jgi:hypothetical protein